jgi:hypothetical protein
MHAGAAVSAQASEDLTAKPEQPVEAFESWRAPSNAPESGEAEALAALGEAALARGEARAARDFIERALLLAPD